MNLGEWRNIFIIVGIIGISIVAVPVISSYFLKTHESFIAMAVLGKEMLADDYYPSNELNINIRDTIPWHVYINNQMGRAQYVAVKFKILNSTLASPNTSLCVPSPAPVIYEFRDILLSNETKIKPFTWEIIEAYNDDHTTEISKIKINEHLLDVDIVIGNDEATRLVFELWLFNSVSKDFSFALISNGESRCVWNQLWINIK